MTLFRRIGNPLRDRSGPGGDASPGCRRVAVLLCIPAACLFFSTVWLVYIGWHTPSDGTRIGVDKYLPKCSLDLAELPVGWQILRKHPYEPYDRVLPGRALGGIKIAFEHRSPRPLSDGPTLLPDVWHEMLLLRSARVASSTYRRLRVGHNARFYLPMVEKDISQADITADEYRFGCSSWYVSTGGRKCRFRGRYDRLVSTIDASISHNQKALDAFVRIVETVDKQMVRCARDPNLPKLRG